MYELEKDWVVALAAATLLLLLLALFLVSFVLLFQKRRLMHKYELEQLKEGFQKTLLTTQNEIQEQTLRNISQELHDNISQQLGLIKIQVSNIQRQNPSLDLSDTKNVLTTTLNDLRALSKSLHTDRITSTPLEESILIELELAKRASGISIGHTIDADTGLLPEQRIILFRIFQELLNNALKHSAASRIDISFKVGNNLMLCVNDNGIGLPSAYKSSIGHLGIHQRVKALNGVFILTSLPGQGVDAKVEVPLG